MQYCKIICADACQSILHLFVLVFYLLFLLIHLVCFCLLLLLFLVLVYYFVCLCFLLVCYFVCFCSLFMLVFSSFILFYLILVFFRMFLFFDLVCFFVCFCSFFLFVYFRLSFLCLYSVNENDTRHALRLTHMQQTKKQIFIQKVFCSLTILKLILGKKILYLNKDW